MISFQTSRNDSLVGIVFEGDWIKAVAMRKFGRRCSVYKSIQAPFAQETLKADPESLGREMRKLLAGAGIRESRCVLCVPLNWILTQNVAIPAVSEEDVESFLQIQIERAFPYPLEDLEVAVSKYQISDGSRFATLAAVPKQRISLLMRLAKAARLRVISITSGVATLGNDEPGINENSLSLYIGEEGIDVAVFCKQGVAALRNLQQVYRDDDGTSIFDIESIVRHLRITLAQLKENLRDPVSVIELFGPSDLVETLSQLLENYAGNLGVPIRSGKVTFSNIKLDESGEVGRHSPPAISATILLLYDKAPAFEFLPPRRSGFQKLCTRLASRRTLAIGTAAAVIVFGVGGAYLFQYLQLKRLSSEWAQIEDTVLEVETLQEQVKQFRGWFDDSADSLEIARAITEAFPEDGAAWAKSLEIKENSEIACSGYARDNQEWLDLLDRLKETEQIQGLKLKQTRGENPIEFSLTFTWKRGG